MSTVSLSMRLFHAALAIVVIALLAMVLVDRRAELGKVRDVADRERAEKEGVRSETVRLQALRDGLKHDDPYVVEFLARERLHFTGPGEMTPPAQTQQH